MDGFAILVVLTVIAATQDQVHGIGGCDVSYGNWVRDDSYPLYEASSCPFLEKEFDCVKNGRPDKDYLKYRWQPLGCNLPRFDGIDFLRRLRGKSIMFIGDSLSLNQWQSLSCLLHTNVPTAKYTSDRSGGLSTFTFPEYDVKVLFSRNAFLVDIIGTSSGRVLKLDSISLENQKLWTGVDVMIFNTWHWWLHTGRKQPELSFGSYICCKWDLIEEDGRIIGKDMDRFVAYEKALNTWATWVESHVDPAKTKVFFQGVSPDHSNSSDWDDPKAGSCNAQTKPLPGPSYPHVHPAEKIVEKVLGAMSKPVELLNVTTLSQLRKDGHPSFYGLGGHRGSDCSHWCLPGVPDTWNILLYAALVGS